MEPVTPVLHVLVLYKRRAMQFAASSLIQLIPFIERHEPSLAADKTNPITPANSPEIVHYITCCPPFLCGCRP